MAIDQTPSTSETESKPIAAIDNEFPAYRAISASGVLSLVLGGASVFCYTSLWFLVVVVGAVAAGWSSLRRIKQLPEILTGAIFAKVGIGLAMLFGLTSVTQKVTQNFFVDFDAGKFATAYVETLKDKPVNEALWYQQPPAYRKTKSPDEIADELKKMKSPSAPDPYGERTKGIQAIKDRLKGGPEEHIHFKTIESKAIDGLTTYANALIELDGPGSKDHPEKEQFALLQLVKSPEGGPGDWVVKELTFPYKPASTTLVVEKKVDDGHGH